MLCASSLLLPALDESRGPPPRALLTSMLVLSFFSISDFFFSSKSRVRYLRACRVSCTSLSTPVLGSISCVKKSSSKSSLFNYFEKAVSVLESTSSSTLTIFSFRLYTGIWKHEKRAQSRFSGRTRAMSGKSLLRNMLNSFFGISGCIGSSDDLLFRFELLESLEFALLIFEFSFRSLQLITKYKI